MESDTDIQHLTTISIIKKNLQHSVMYITEKPTKNTLLIYLLLFSKLDHIIKDKWEERTVKSEEPKIKDLIDLLQKRSQILAQ